MAQTVVSGKDSHKKINEILHSLGCKKILLVCDSSFRFLSIKDEFDALCAECVKFDGFTPNPLYEDVCKGVELFRQEGCQAVVAVGGGSTIDVAKCIKLYCKMDPSVNYLSQEYEDSGVPLIAVPTTAGTGSESTRYAVIYFEGKKQSVTHTSIIPDYAVLDSGVLKTLPVYQKKCTMLDALCQGIESWWSVNSTEDSRKFSKAAVQMIVKNIEGYIFENDDLAAENIMHAANLAGQAINITQTTAAHAMSYKLTSMYRLPHGHAVAICLPGVWNYMNTHIDGCIDKRGAEYLKGVFSDIAEMLGCKTVPEAIEKFREMLKRLEISLPKAENWQSEIDTLTASVNPVRLKNNPVLPDEDALHKLYEEIVLL